MADATVPQPRREEALSLGEDRRAERSLAFPGRLPWLRIVLSTVLTALLIAFLALGTVRVGAGNWNGRRMSVSQIWARFLDFLAGQGFSAPVIALVVVAALIALAGSAYLVWLAFDLRNAEAGDSLDTTISQ